jgi:hypothetical protein
VFYGKLDKTTNQIKIVSYKPTKKQKDKFEPFFHGTVERGDLEQTKEEYHD